MYSNQINEFQDDKENDELSTGGNNTDEDYVPEEEQSQETDNEEVDLHYDIPEQKLHNSKIIDEDNNNHLQCTNEKDVFESSVNSRLSRELHINEVETGKDKCKKYFCKFCNKLICKFVRHLEVLHKEEKEVSEFLLLPKGELHS